MKNPYFICQLEDITQIIIHGRLVNYLMEIVLMDLEDALTAAEDTMCDKIFNVWGDRDTPETIKMDDIVINDNGTLTDIFANVNGREDLEKVSKIWQAEKDTFYLTQDEISAVNDYFKYQNTRFPENC